MKRDCRIFIGLFMALIFLVSCSMLTQNTTTAPPLTPMQKATIMLHSWNMEFKDTMTLATRTVPPLNDVEKALVVKKKAVLTQTKPLIDVYSSTVMNGAAPDQATEDSIYTLLNSIGATLWIR